jgi:hypothetical protein
MTVPSRVGHGDVLRREGVLAARVDANVRAQSPDCRRSTSLTRPAAFNAREHHRVVRRQLRPVLRTLPASSM